jgi:hypothetical protein
MTNPLIGWQRINHRQALVLVPPDAPQRAQIRIDERLTPLASAEDIVDQARARMAAPADVVDIERVTTAEGEFAAIATLRGAHDGSRFERTMGMVFGDTHYAVVDAVTTAAELTERCRAAARHLTLHYALGLGVRRRRFLYAQPAGWQARARGLYADWYPLDYPQRRSVITVSPASPIARDPATEDVERFLHDQPLEPFEPTEPLRVRRLLLRPGFQAELASQRGTFMASRQPALVCRARLVDATYRYELKLESAGDDTDAASVFESIVRSIEPLGKLRVSATPCEVWSE